MHSLSSSWSIWVHYLKDTDWSQSSYINIHTCSHLEEIIAFHETIILSENVLRKYMLFFMKESVLPMWEDSANRLGGCFWFTIPIENVYIKWKTILYTIIGNTISDNPRFIEDITGVVLSPKKHYYIVQLWMKTREYSITDICSSIQKVADNNIIFKTHNV